MCAGCLGLLVGFFALVIFAAQADLATVWIAALAIIGGLAGRLSAWVLYLQLLKRQARSTRIAVLVLLLLLLVLVLPMPFRYVLVRG